MKKIISFLVVCILLFSLFIIPSSAVVVSVPEYNITATETVHIGTKLFVDVSLTFDPFNNTVENYSSSFTDNYTSGQDIFINNRLHLTSKNGDYLIKNGGTAKVVFSDVWLGGRYDIGSKQVWLGVYTLITVTIYYSDGTFDTIERIDGLTTNYSNRLHTFSFEFSPKGNVTGIVFNSSVQFSSNSNGSLTYNCRLGEYDDPDSSFILQVDHVQASDEGSFWTRVINSLESISNFIFDFPRLICDKVVLGIKDIFIPDTAVLEKEFKATVENITTQLGVSFDTYENLFEHEVAPEDVVETYYIPGLGNLKLKFLDTEFLIEGIAFFRPVIRAFLVLLLIFYNWKQVLTLIDQNPGIAAGAVQGLSSQSTQMRIDL